RLTRAERRALAAAKRLNSLNRAAQISTTPTSRGCSAAVNSIIGTYLLDPLIDPGWTGPAGGADPDQSDGHRPVGTDPDRPVAAGLGGRVDGGDVNLVGVRVPGAEYLDVSADSQHRHVRDGRRAVVDGGAGTR